MPLTKEQQSKGGKNGKPGLHTRTKQWNALAEKFCGEYADDVIKYLDTLKSEEDKTDFFNAYKDLLKYFKPALQSARVEIDPPIEVNQIVLSKADVKKIVDKL